MTKEQSCNCHSFMSDVNILCMTAEFIVWQTSVATTGAVRECCFLCKFILSLRLSCRNTHFLFATISQSNTYIWMYMEFNWNMKLVFYFWIALFMLFIFIVYKHFSKLQVCVDVRLHVATFYLVDTVLLMWKI